MVSLLNSTCDSFHTLEYENSTILHVYHQEYFIKNLLWPLLIIFGIISNSCFLLVVAKIPYMHTVTNAYLSNLACSDLMYLVTIAIDEVVLYDRSSIPVDATIKGIAGCGILITFKVLSFMESPFLVSLVAFERYLAICFPIKHRLVKGPRRTLTIIIMSWLISFALAVSSIPLYAGEISTYCVRWPGNEQFQNRPQKINICSPVRGIPVTKYIPLLWIIVAAVITVFNITMYVGIMRKLRKRAQDYLNKHQSSNHADQARQQVANMLIMNGTLFFLCWAYNSIQLLEMTMFSLGNKQLFPSSSDSIRQWLYSGVFLLNASVNPIVYNVTNTRYRNAFKQLFTCLQNGSGTNEEHTVNVSTTIWNLAILFRWNIDWDSFNTNFHHNF